MSNESPAHTLDMAAELRRGEIAYSVGAPRGPIEALGERWVLIEFARNTWWVGLGLCDAVRFARADIGATEIELAGTLVVFYGPSAAGGIAPMGVIMRASHMLPE